MPRSQRPRLVVADFLVPRSRRLCLMQSTLLRRVDAWACIRSGDIDNLVRLFKVDACRCRWVPFPVGRVTGDASDVALIEASETTGKRSGPRGRLVYSAGNAHRDWPCVITALTLVDCEATLSMDHKSAGIEGMAIPPIRPCSLRSRRRLGEAWPPVPT